MTLMTLIRLRTKLDKFIFERENNKRREWGMGDDKVDIQLQTLQAMANGSDLNMENNIRKRDTQFISTFWLKTLENQMKYILPCILLEHTGGINLCFYMKHDLKHRKKRHNVFVRCFGTNN